MNLGFYIESTNESERNLEIYHALNDAVDNKELNDACVFFNNVSYNPVHTRFGLFNGTDIWHFTAHLIATSINNVGRALKSVNKFNLTYLFNPEEKNLLGLLSLVGKVDVIARNEEEGKEFYRLTGTKAKVLDDFSVKSIQKVLS